MLVGVLALLLGGAGVVAVVVHDDDDDRRVSEAVVGDVTTTTSTTVLETATSTSAVPAAPSTSSPPTTAGRSARTAAPPTTARPPTNTTARPQTTTTSPDLLLCAAEQIDISAGTDSLSYPAGRPVTMTTTIRNRSSAPCFYRGYSVTLSFLDPVGRPLASTEVNGDSSSDRRFAPGARLSHTLTWDPAACPTAPCATPAPGFYSVAASWSFSGGTYAATMQFVLR